MSKSRRQKKDPVAGRLMVVGRIQHYLTQGREVGEAIEQAATEPVEDVHGVLKERCVRTHRRWWERYQKGGAEALKNKPRPPRQGSKRLSEKQLNFLIGEHASDLVASIPELLRRGEQKGYFKPGETPRAPSV